MNAMKHTHHVIPNRRMKWSTSSPMRVAASGRFCRVAASGCKWLLLASGREWLQVAAFNEWPQVAAFGEWPRVAASGYRHAESPGTKRFFLCLPRKVGGNKLGPTCCS